jgi:phage tail sheath gpL-like
MYPNLVAGAVGAAVAVAMQHSLHADPPRPMNELLTEALAQMAAGLPTP